MPCWEHRATLGLRCLTKRPDEQGSARNSLNWDQNPAENDLCQIFQLHLHQAWWIFMAESFFCSFVGKEDLVSFSTDGTALELTLRAGLFGLKLNLCISSHLKSTFWWKSQACELGIVLSPSWFTLYLYYNPKPYNALPKNPYFFFQSVGQLLLTLYQVSYIPFPADIQCTIFFIKIKLCSKEGINFFIDFLIILIAILTDGTSNSD